MPPPTTRTQPAPQKKPETMPARTNLDSRRRTKHSSTALPSSNRRSRDCRDVQREIKQLGARQKALPPIDFALGVRDAKKIVDSPIHLRGERSKTGDIVPRGFLSCVNDIDTLSSPVTGDPLPAIDKSQSGRLQLAAWLAHPDNPLTPRVVVNRVWQHLFGRGLVESVDNFGTNGSSPSHPQLLDHLARRFVEVHDWSIKSLIRELVHTRTYRLSSNYQEQNIAADPANEFLWRMSRRRLEAEPLRDAMLAASGQLRLDRPEASPVAEIGEGEVGRGINMKPLQQPYPYRSVYLPIIRRSGPREPEGVRLPRAQ